MSLPDPRETPTLTVPEAAALLGLGRSGAYDAVERGEIPSIRLGGRVVIPTAALLQMLALDSSSGSGRDALTRDALRACAVEIRSAANDAQHALQILADALAGAAQLADVLASDSEAGPASPATATTTDRTGPGHDSASHIRAV